MQYEESADLLYHDKAEVSKRNANSCAVTCPRHFDDSRQDNVRKDEILYFPLAWRRLEKAYEGDAELLCNTSTNHTIFR